MLSRRSVRIKAMQLLFSVNRDEQLDLEEAKKRYWASIEDTYRLYLLNLLVIVRVSKTASEDLVKRSAKRLPTEADKVFTDKLYNNSLIKNLEQNKELLKSVKKLEFTETLNEDYCTKIYNEFLKNEVYLSYLSKESTNEDHLEVLLELYRFCRQNELFNEIMEDHYGTWQDDKSVVVGSVKKTLKRIPEVDDKFIKDYHPADETVNEFGFQLLVRTLENDKVLHELIEPTLKNWDSERLAIIDMILLKMATCEFTGFESIPTKVTVNEYIDIAKNYSTAKSKDFINGVLDRIMKDLQEAGSIKKTGRGLD